MPHLHSREDAIGMGHGQGDREETPRRLREPGEEDGDEVCPRAG
jgi:hypothetical protein